MGPSNTITSPEAGDVDATSLPAWRRLWVHAAALGLLLVALLPAFNASAPVVADEGLYGAQVAALADGSWSLPHPAPELDPDGSATALVGPSVVDGERVIPYSRRPAYPLLLTPFYVVAGGTGLLLVSVLGSWIAAVAGAVLARRRDPRYALPTLWLIGIGSPLLFSTYVVQGHTVAAGCAGLMLVGIAWAVDDRSWAGAALAAVAAGALVLVRSEGTIMVLAACLTLAVTALRRSPWRVDRPTAGVAALLAAVGAAAFALNHVLATAVSDDRIGKTGSVVDSTSPLNAVWVNLLRPWFGSGSAANAGAAVVVLAVLLAALSLRLLPRFPLLPVALLGMAAVVSLVRQLDPLLLISGMLPAFPVLAALLLLRRRDLDDVPTRRLLVLSAATAVGLVLTVYGELEGTQWGGRFFLVLLPALGPLVVLGLDRGRAMLPGSYRVVAGAAVAVVTLSLSVFSVRINLATRDLAGSLVDGTFAYAADLGLDDPLIVVAEVQPTGTGRLFWESWQRGAKVLQPNIGLLRSTLQAAREDGRDQVLLVSDTDRGSFEMILGAPLKDAGWEISDARAVNDIYSVIVLTDATD